MLCYAILLLGGRGVSPLRSGAVAPANTAVMLMMLLLLLMMMIAMPILRLRCAKLMLCSCCVNGGSVRKPWLILSVAKPSTESRTRPTSRPPPPLLLTPSFPLMGRLSSRVQMGGSGQVRSRRVASRSIAFVCGFPFFDPSWLVSSRPFAIFP